MTAAHGTLGPAIAEFFEGCLVYPEGDKMGQPFVMDDWQRQDTDIIFETDADGRALWKIVVWGMPTGCGKSPMAAGYALHALVDSTGGPQVLCGAASRPQAKIVHKHAQVEAFDGPLEDYLDMPRVRDAFNPIRCPSNDGVFRVLSADGGGQEGLNPTFVVIDELHVFTTKKQVALYTALQTKLHKRRDSRMVIISTAGEDKESLLGDLVDAITKAGQAEISRHGCRTVVRDYKAKRLLIWYGAPDTANVRDPKIWRACNPASWITDEALQFAAGSNPESVFRRYYLNQWVEGEDAAIQPAVWDACCAPAVKIPHGTDIWVGVDVGERHDRSSVSWVADVGERVAVRAKVMLPMQVEGMKTTLPALEALLRQLMDLYRVRRINYDKWQMRDLAARLASEGMPMFEMAQNDTEMVPASQLVFKLIGDGVIAHNGDEVLRAHVLGTAGVITRNGGWRFTKRLTKQGQRDLRKLNDACIAMTMALAARNEDKVVKKKALPLVVVT